MTNPTTYQVWQHAVTAERWLVRIEFETLTGIFGPLPAGERPPDPDTIYFEDHPDDLEWIVRASDNFRLAH